ncbi:aromatic ring-hydroxylating oxygenase subunit alpha [Glacieibacterium frigidum]|uniref:Aromatic ring-hydroxylating dioxygenase subunit alpha n=1 Tax=Glacieibacterium frigidum TaxID=2593303 RepID=A0A552UFM3_9SPHN|nr:aromatic ring-hydroxylating dioxygenase subunit alpha [Glacieibacterium frigidum]TRW16989.1 aromatic ring-hydroxylating dioxygenase subunit alpha [Glacieibacterium frigidum]
MSLAVVADTRDPLDDYSLPGWLYHDPEFHALEMARVIRPSWQIVCHLSDLPKTGDWHSLEYAGESVIVVRGEHGEVRAFTNVCRHRGSRLVDGACGSARKLVCPYHAWVYELDGRLSGVPQRSQYKVPLPQGLIPVEHEVWHGFVFVRLEGGGPSVASMMAPHEDEIAPYRFAEMQPLKRVTERPRSVNWKNLCDNYSDGLHVPVAHPGLKRLFGDGYWIEAGAHVDRLGGTILDLSRGSWSERAYQRLKPRADHLDDARQNLWLYFKLWPNIAFDIYADGIDFMQFLPTGPTTTSLRESAYALPDDRREMRAARYLNARINREVNREDTILVTRVQAGMQSASYKAGPLGDSEVCLRSFAQRLRRVIPEARLERPPTPGWSAARTG